MNPDKYYNMHTGNNFEFIISSDFDGSMVTGT